MPSSRRLLSLLPLTELHKGSTGPTENIGCRFLGDCKIYRIGDFGHNEGSFGENKGICNIYINEPEENGSIVRFDFVYVEPPECVGFIIIPKKVWNEISNDMKARNHTAL
ncbi:hypothetical protein [Thermococcus sp. GR6]|uniref:hypothetical protein n=1 Tax=Thermococcus sp. GR6 TaxID=1638256 RepID=UPI001430B332|nr:hypothetical protein [Thermococcus sp. GR6]NJE42173.1 hypothetical protein [Thermococcus sp. GR6]